MDHIAFKAAVETCGYQYEDLAEILGTDLATVKLWEQPAYPSAVPEEVEEFLEEAVRLHHEAIEYAVDKAVEAASKTGMQDKLRVNLAYYRTQHDYDSSWHGDVDHGPYTVANARTRAAAERLRALGFEVEFVAR